MAQQTQPRDSKGRFLKAKPTYKDLERIIDEQKTLIAELEKLIRNYDLVNNALFDFFQEHLPFWKTKTLSKFKENLAKQIEK